MSKIAGVPWQRAIAEFLIIFAGITISLLADDWRQSRFDARRERSALTEMLADLEADSAELAPKLRRLQAWDQAALWTQGNVGRTDLEEDSVVASILQLFLIHHYQPVRSTYEGLRAGGDLDLVRDDGVRRLMVQYYELNQSKMIQFDALVFQWYNALWDATQEMVLWKANPNATTFFDRDSGNPFALLVPWSEISQDPVFLNRSAMLGIHGSVAAPDVQEALQKNVELRQAISEYLR